jgi:hypothetical protein
MPIHSIKGEIMDIAPLKSEAMAVWMCSGFNTRNAVWRYYLASRQIEKTLAHSSGNLVAPSVLNSAYKLDALNEPWRLNHETLWEITSNNQGKLKFLYIFPNAEDKSRLDSLKDIDSLINQCLNVLQKNTIKSVSFILIPAFSNTNAVNFDIDDIDSANQMIDSINDWLKMNNSNMDIYLVDRQGSFNSLL